MACFLKIHQGRRQNVGPHLENKNVYKNQDQQNKLWETWWWYGPKQQIFYSNFKKKSKTKPVKPLVSIHILGYHLPLSMKMEIIRYWICSVVLQTVRRWTCCVQLSEPDNHNYTMWISNSLTERIFSILVELSDLISLWFISLKFQIIISLWN